MSTKPISKGSPVSRNPNPTIRSDQSGSYPYVPESHLVFLSPRPSTSGLRCGRRQVVFGAWSGTLFPLPRFLAISNQEWIGIRREPYGEKKWRWWTIRRRDAVFVRRDFAIRQAVAELPIGAIALSKTEGKRPKCIGDVRAGLGVGIWQFARKQKRQNIRLSWRCWSTSK